MNSMDDDEALDEDWADETLFDVRTLCDFALCHGELRDELYMQLVSIQPVRLLDELSDCLLDRLSNCRTTRKRELLVVLNASLF